MPLHACNVAFFKLCVYDCGRLLRLDDFIVEKQRFDYSRVLLSTTSLEIIDTEATILVDGVLYDFKIIEEWGFSLGEDACLFDDEESHDDVNSDMGGAHDDGDVSCDVDDLLNHLSEDWKQGDGEHCTTPSNDCAYGGSMKTPTVVVPVLASTSLTSPAACSVPKVDVMGPKQVLV